jgi:thioredoxin-dependent peroxiredoxin
MIQIGDNAPYFKMPTGEAENDFVDLNDLKNKWVILYFYPKDSTPGCTTEACDFRDSFERFKQKDCVLIGVSKDSLKSHAKFQHTQNLPFLLASDQNTDVCERYSIYVEKSMYGRKYMGIERSTFIINPEGKIAYIWRNVKVKGHVEEVFKVLTSFFLFE